MDVNLALSHRAKMRDQVTQLRCSLALFEYILYARQIEMDVGHPAAFQRLLNELSLSCPLKTSLD